MKPQYLQRASQIMQRIDELASISEDPACLTRLFGSPAFIEARNKVVNWMQQAGCQTRIDNIGNVRGKKMSSNPQAKTLVIASHIDTVVNAGKYDGPLGVIMALDLLEHLQQPLPFHIELIAFSDEEGCRFHSSYLGSKVVAGTFDISVLQRQDAFGVSLQQAIENMGGNCQFLLEDAIPAGDWLGYFEIHIEQGPILFERNIPVALVTAIAGQKRIAIGFKGQAGHAGTVPMHMRSDALCAAAEFVLAVEQYAKKQSIVATVGKLEIAHAASNVIPGDIVCTLDVRSADQQLLQTAYSQLQQLATVICRQRNIALQWSMVQENPPVTCNVTWNELLQRAITSAGHDVVALVSGAGHDAVAISAVSPVAMLFVRCFEGISHNPLENVDLKDLAAAVEVSSNFITHLIDTFNQA